MISEGKTGYWPAFSPNLEIFVSFPNLSRSILSLKLFSNWYSKLIILKIHFSSICGNSNFHEDTVNFLSKIRQCNRKVISKIDALKLQSNDFIQVCHIPLYETFTEIPLIRYFTKKYWCKKKYSTMHFEKW